MHNFKDEVAASRTFVFVREIEPLLSAGLIKGGDLDNAIVIYERKMSQESYDKLADVMGVPHMDADQLGYINHKPLVWPNECARHKLLDVIGDLALIGKPIKGRIIATRPVTPSTISLRVRCGRKFACMKYRHRHTTVTANR